MPDDRNTLEVLYRRHASSVFRRARRLLGSDADAHEVVQDIFLSLYERPDQYAGKSTMTTFLYSATTHACLNRIRNQKNRLRLLREEWSRKPDDESHRPTTPEELSLLHGVLRQMPEDLAKAAVYYYVDDLTHEDISRLLGCSRRHVGNLLQRVARFGGAQETKAC